MELQVGAVDCVERNMSLGQDVVHQASAVLKILVRLALLFQLLGLNGLTNKILKV